MTQAAPTPYVYYIADGLRLPFPYPWRIGAASDLQVFRGDSLVTNYSVTGVGVAGGGNVVFATAPAAASVIFIRRVTPQIQDTDYINNDPFGAETHEWILDKLTRMIQDYNERLSRMPTFAVTSGAGLRNMVFPREANKVLGWNSDASALTLYEATPGQLAPALFLPWFNVRTYGAQGDGVTNDSPAIQLAAGALEVAGSGLLFFPPGTYRLESRITLTNAHVVIAGAGMETSILCVANPDGGIRYLSTDDGAAEGTALPLIVRDLTILAESAVPLAGVNRGTALHASWPSPIGAPETRSCIMTHVNIRSRTYVATPTTHAYFSKGIHLQNASVTSLTHCSVMQVGNLYGEMIHFDNQAEPLGSYSHQLHGLVTNGGDTSLLMTGWMENVTLSQFEFVGAQYGIRSVGLSVTGTPQPVWIIANGHVNANIDCITMTQRGWVNIHHCYLLRYLGAGPDPDADGAIIRIVNGNNVTIADNDMNNVADLSMLDQGIVLADVHHYTITGNKLSLAGSTIGGTVTGVLIAGVCQHGIIAQNVLDGYAGAGDNAIVVATGSPGFHECLTIVNNRLNLWTLGIVLHAPFNVEVQGNRAVNVPTLITHSGAWALDVILRDNHPHSGPLVITGTSGSPSVAGAEDGLVILNQSAPTNLSFFIDGYEGMVIEVEAANSNTTLIHSANLFLAGLANYAMTAGDIITLRRRDTTWREVSRTNL